jgi:NADH-quinone oxidoreductase subunit E
MSVRRLADEQPEIFTFTPENESLCEAIIKKYPEGRAASAVISLLWIAQKQNDYWLPKPAIERVAEKLGMAYIRVLEIATFYTMFNLAPVGRFYIQMCGTTPCVLAGSDAIAAILRRRVGEQGVVTANGLFSWREVECLGACCNAPMVQINDDYYEDLDSENFEKLLDDLAAGRAPRIGSQTGRMCSEPAGELTTLTSFYGLNGLQGPLSTPPRPRFVDAAAARDEFAAREEMPVEPALERLKQEAERSPGKPASSIVATGGERTTIPISESAKAVEAAVQKTAAAAGGSHRGGPASPPGIEPSGGNRVPDKTSP